MRWALIAVLAVSACSGTTAGPVAGPDRAASEQAAVAQMMAVNPLLAAPDAATNARCVAEAATAPELERIAAVRNNFELTDAILPIMTRPALRACGNRMREASTL